MRLIWAIENEDVKQVHAFFHTHENNPLVQERKRRNLADTQPRLNQAAIWEAMVFTLLTTQQRSGPESAVARFVRERPFPLSYEQCLREEDLRSWAAQTLTDFGGIRRTNRLANELHTNLSLLEEGLWPETLRMLDDLRRPHGAREEREAAAFIATRFKGFGPKQSRNFLQMLGLTRYEVPLDSRITRWLNEFGFPIHLSATALADPHYYDFVSDGLQELCRQSDIVPCLLDAAIFASFDDGGWTAENVVW